MKMIQKLARGKRARGGSDSAAAVAMADDSEGDDSGE